MPGKWGSARPAYIKDKYEMIKQPIFCKVIKHRLSQISEAINSFPRTASSGAVIRNPTHDYTHSHTQTQCRLLTHSLSLSLLRLWWPWDCDQVHKFVLSHSLVGVFCGSYQKWLKQTMNSVHIFFCLWKMRVGNEYPQCPHRHTGDSLYPTTQHSIWFP